MTTFRPIQTSDIDIIVPMMQEFYSIDNYPIDIAISKALFLEFIENPHLGKAWLIYSDEEIVGYIILTFVFSFEYKGTIAFLDELYISDKARGKGIGKKALDFIHQEALSLSLKIIYLEIENHNEIAQKLYLSKDFVVHNRSLMKLTLK
ncbi:GNAT family N-acetyltransferase [Flavobacterium lindanitolerans]|jgi:GNAT superfamily N-acetyltransferase|uniref:GNAT family acetyltransferase n=1 Tax=Flavobacterium lindanitolerans TaxID=428988 RepID=A0A497UVJ3_9FLAO|nr:GNAT family N-acetyltransferase [Flavobacterium lindanitolerans]PKW29389.1 GNAT family acetyltransferase [Flavobacterium lindanitolerans]RLJ35111.1 L-amino acid N-acyltransferase YncA [Flavobacterium lindanitolerans]